MRALPVLILSFVAISFGFHLRNVKTGHCVYDYDSSTEPSHYILDRCSLLSTNFQLTEGQTFNQSRIESVMTWFNLGQRKCMQIDNDNFPNDKQLFVNGYKCNNPDIRPEYFQWIFTNIGNNQYSIQHAKSGMCMKAENGYRSYLSVFNNCSTTDSFMLWTKEGN